MDKNFQEIYEKEKNENTALILMLSVLSDKLSKMIDILNKANALSSKLHAMLEEEKEKPKAEIVIFEPLTPEDYME